MWYTVLLMGFLLYILGNGKIYGERKETFLLASLLMHRVTWKTVRLEYQRNKQEAWLVTEG